MVKYNIPKKITLGGQTINVQVRKTIEIEGATGCYKSYENIILVQTHIQGIPIAKEQVEQTFWHEYAHALFSSCRKEELSSDEELVDLMGEFLYQSIGKTIKWS